MKTAIPMAKEMMVYVSIVGLKVRLLVDLTVVASCLADMAHMWTD